MNYLSVENLTKSYGARTLFENITFGIEKSQKVAFIAKNGTGKTTLLKILTLKEGYDSGRIVYRKGLKLAYLPQVPDLDSSRPIMEVIFKRGSKTVDAIRDYKKALTNPDDSERMQSAFDKMDALNAWDYETRIQQILGKLGIHDLEQKISELSGGQRKRIALAQVLIDKPDFLILDEPTNHLDVEMIEWLEDFLNNSGITIFMVTHDRYFLERVCDEIIELDDKSLYRYKGNYSYFLQKKEERESVFDANVKRAKNLFRKELEWMRRMPKARGTKSKSREESFYEIKKNAHQKRNSEKVEIEVNISRLGGKILEFHRVRKSFGEQKIIDGFDYVFKKGERVGIVGKNGVGKSTLLNIIMGKEPLDGGKVVTGETVVFGYYTQEGMKLKDEKRVIEVVKDIAEVIPLTKGKKLTASQLLERFLFPKSMHFNHVSKLSGGEKRRLYLLTILMKNPNFLILDEPTNDLDIITLNILEDFLLDFSGCIIVVSHDRYFMDKLVDHVFILEGKGVIKDFIGRYCDYRVSKNQQQDLPKKENSNKEKGVNINKKEIDQPKTKLTFKEKLEFESLENEIPELEERKEKLIGLLNEHQSNYEKLNELTKQMEEVLSNLEDKTDRWLFLSEYVQ